MIHPVFVAVVKKDPDLCWTVLSMMIQVSEEILVGVYVERLQSLYARSCKAASQAPLDAIAAMNQVRVQGPFRGNRGCRSFWAHIP
jgi:hypothetical protein